MSRLLLIQRWIAATTTAYVVTGLVTRLTIKDVVPIVSVIYYTTPLPLVTCVAAISGFLWLGLKKPRLATCLIVVGFVCYLWTVRTLHFTNTREPEPSDRCVMFWNASSCDFGWSGVVAAMKSQNPDVIALVESGSTDADAIIHWQEAFPEYEIGGIAGDMLLLSRGKIVSDDFGTLGNGGQYKHLAVEMDEEVLQIFIVDVKSAPLKSRRETLKQLAQVVTSLEDQPVLVMGDFNTPADSVHFVPLRETFVNAFESHGNGYACTWPNPFPVLQLDHIWTNHRVAVSLCTTSWTIRSDHRPVTAWLQVLP